MPVPSQIERYINDLTGDTALLGLVHDVLRSGDKLHGLRRTHDDVYDLIAAAKADKSIPFKLKYKECAAEKSPIRHSTVREKLGIPESDRADVLSRDVIKIKPRKSNPKKREDLKHSVSFDAAANYKDGNHNWGMHANIEDGEGNITHAAIYMPETGQIYFANEEGAHVALFPSFQSRSNEIVIRRIAIGALSPKFNCEVGSWHTKERAPVKMLFTMPLREEVGGSLRETGMKEAPFPWVALNRMGYSFIGNMKPTDGRSGAFIAAQGGANVMRIPLTSDSQGREIVFASHPAVQDDVMRYFDQALELAGGDVTIGEPVIINRNTDPALARR
jgi:hypothetical protein